MSSNLISRQQGLTMTSWLVVLAIALFFIMVAVKMIPTYLENYSISKVMTGLQTDRSVREMGKRELKRTILKRFKINGVYDFKAEDLKITPAAKKGLNVSVAYEVRKPVIGNVYVVMTFDETVTLKR